jgi:hypothetical protein
VQRRTAPPVSNGSVAQHSEENRPGHEHDRGPESPVVPERGRDDTLAALAGEGPAVGEDSLVAPELGAAPAPVPPTPPAPEPAPEPTPEPDPAVTVRAERSRAAALADAARAEAQDRARAAAEAHAARTAARAAAAEARAQAEADAEAEERTRAEDQMRTAAVERSRAAAAAHVAAVPGDDRGSFSDADDTEFLPGFAAPIATPMGHGRDDDAVPVLRRTRRPVAGLVALVLFGMVAAFFGWVSADPFWLATGQGSTGTVTVSRCDAGACEGQFAATGFTADGVALSGIAPEDRHTGATAPGRMLASDRTWAYSGPAWALHLRWALGLAIVLVSGLLLGALTGARFLRPLGLRAVVGVRLLAVAGPLALFAGMLGAALL